MAVVGFLTIRQQLDEIRNCSEELPVSIDHSVTRVDVPLMSVHADLFRATSGLHNLPTLLRV